METYIEEPGLPGSAEPYFLFVTATNLKGKSAIERQMTLEGKPTKQNEIVSGNPNSFINKQNFKQ